MSTQAPLLSVVVALGRSGDEPRDFVGRFRRLLSSLERGASVLPAGALEVVVVDWNAGQDVPSLREMLSPTGTVSVRIIEVSREIHERAVQSSGRRFFEGAAKNTGVVRARAERVLLTNPDVVIRSDLLEFCVRAALDSTAFVRADRYDFRTTVFMAHIRHGTREGDPIHVPVEPGSAECTWPRSRALGEEVDGAEIWGPPGGLPDHFLRGAHTNGAGDFLCVSTESFRAAGGWSEEPTIYHHGDALMVAQLLGIGLQQVIYAHPGALLHEDHPRITEEERGGGGGAWPAFLARIQHVIDGPAIGRVRPFGLEHDELPEHVLT